MAAFWLVQVVPGDPGRNALGAHATPAQIQAWNVRNGLDGGIAERYLQWLTGFVQGNWGTSLVFGEPVVDLVSSRLYNSIVVGLIAFAIAGFAAALLGCLQAYTEGRKIDRTLTMALSAISALPEFVVGVVLLLFFSIVLGVVPTRPSITGDSLRVPLSSMVLPATVLALAYIPIISRMVRTGVVGALNAPYHRTAVLKGLPPLRVVTHHVARNAMIPTVSLLGISLGALLSGNAVVEWVFGYPGLGALTVTAAVKKDVFLLESCVMVIGISCLLIILLSDVMVVWLDRRIEL